MLLSPFMRGRIAAAALAFWLAACSPTFDWREIRPDDSEAVAMLPCKPSTDARMVSLAGARVRMVLVACRAADANWALAFADVEDPARVGPALQELRAASAGNLGGAPVVVGPMRVPGMTPNALAERVRVQGHLSSVGAMNLESGFFVRGTRVYQATVMGRSIDAEALSVFFDGLKLRT